MPKRRMTAARILQIKQFQIAGAKAASGPGSLKWAKSSILFRHGAKQAATSRIVRIYQPKTVKYLSTHTQNAYIGFMNERKINYLLRGRTLPKEAGF